ncbi:MAG: hypothetical protein RJA36_2847 [Pseudomonadota bacterium]
MPWYRINGMQVHLKLGGKAAKNPPAPCAARTAPDNPIVPQQRYLCDFRLPSGATCDMPLCAEHATQIGPDRHLCPRHVGAGPEAA